MKNKLKSIVNDIKENLNGMFSWEEYLDHGNHDHKFGPNKFEFVIQMPVVGILATILFYILLFIIGPIIKLCFSLRDWLYERKKKSNSKSC